MSEAVLPGATPAALRPAWRERLSRAKRVEELADVLRTVG